MTEKSFTERQQKMLEEAVRHRREVALNAGVAEAVAKKPKVSPEEYRRRMNEMLREDERIAELHKDERIKTAMEEWNTIVGPRFAKATIENPRVEALVNEKVDRIVNNGPLHRSCLVLIGGLGIGKTWTAYAYARALVAQGVLAPTSLIHGTETSLLTPIALAGYERPDKIYEFLNSKNRFYIIDEVGRATFRNAEIRHEIWYEIINHVYEKHIPLVLTSNKSTTNFTMRASDGTERVTNELEMWIGEAAYDRLKHISNVIIPSTENKRAQVGRLMDEGKTLGLDKMEESEDPFGGLLKKPSGNAKTSPAPLKSQPNIQRSISDLRPKRR